jgi:hypothetical protein
MRNGGYSHVFGLFIPVSWLPNTLVTGYDTRLNIKPSFLSKLHVSALIQWHLNCSLYEAANISWCSVCWGTTKLALSNPIFLSTAYSPAAICFGRERGWWITCNYPTVFKQKNMEKQKEYNLRYLLAKVHTTWGKASDRLRQRATNRNKNRVGRLPTSERNRKIILSDEVRRRIAKGWDQRTLCLYSKFCHNRLLRLV